jgi:hypothetical protein
MKKLPKQSELRRMLHIKMLRFTPLFLVPNSSLVADTATHVIAPVHVPMMAVLMHSRMKAPTKAHGRP